MVNDKERKGDELALQQNPDIPKSKESKFRQMMRYETYKPSGIEWLGDIPEHWEAKRLKDFADIIMGQSPDSTSYNDEEQGLPFFQGKADFGELYPVPTMWCTEPTKIAEPNDILISVRAPVGELNICDQRSCIGRGLTAIRIKKGDRKFAYYSLQILNEELKISVTGSTFEAVSSNDVSVLKYLCPPTEEQSSISAYLDAQTQKIDRLISNKKAQVERLKELRQIEINNAVTKGLNPHAPMKGSGVEWLGQIPEHWEVKRLKDILIDLKSGDGFSANDLEDEAAFEVFGGNGVLGYINKFNFDGKAIVIGRVGAKCGNINIIEGKKWISDNALFCRTRQHYEFVYYLLEAMNLNQYSNQNAQPLITGTIVRYLKFALPPKDEQLQIALHLKQRTAAIDKLIKNTEAQTEKLQELRKIKIYEAVTGKVKCRA